MAGGSPWLRGPLLRKGNCSQQASCQVVWVCYKGTRVSGGIFLEISKAEQVENPCSRNLHYFFSSSQHLFHYFSETVLASLQRSLADGQFLCLLWKGIPGHLQSLPLSSEGASWPEFAPAGPDPGRHLRRSLLQLGSQCITPRLPRGLTGFPAPSPGEAGEGSGGWN